MTNYQTIARLAGPFGIKGEMRVIFMQDVDPKELIKQKQVLRLEKTGQVLTPTHVRGLNEGVAMRFTEIPDRNVAETYIKSGLQISEDFVKALDPVTEDEFFLEDLIGCDLFIEGDLVKKGTITALYNFGAGDLLEVTLADSDKNYLIPFMDDLLVDVLIADKKVIMTPEIMAYFC